MNKLLEDQFKRKFSYIRLSITERCNFACEYCLPNGYIANKCALPELHLNEIALLLDALSELGISKIRLTGGEPTIRRDLLEIIALIKSYPSFQQIGLTTNGYKLLTQAKLYYESGVTNLNLSLDSLLRERFYQITKVDRLNYLLSAIEHSLSLGFASFKLNTVLLKAMSKEELKLFIEFVRERPLSIRFIELMPTAENTAYFKTQHRSSTIITDYLLKEGWQLKPREYNSGPAKEYFNVNYLGTVGIIAPYAKDFCTSCNRLRFTSQGELKLCLFSGENISIRHLLQDKASQEELKSFLINSLLVKKSGHDLSNQKVGNMQNFSLIGG